MPRPQERRLRTPIGTGGPRLFPLMRQPRQKMLWRSKTEAQWWKGGRRDACIGWRESRSLNAAEVPVQRKRALIAIDVAIRANEQMRIISGLILTPFVASLKKVRRPALEAGIGALLFLSLIEFVGLPSLLKCSGPNPRTSYHACSKRIIMNNIRLVSWHLTILSSNRLSERSGRTKNGSLKACR